MLKKSKDLMVLGGGNSLTPHLFYNLILMRCL